jgi:acetolactate synthase-1/2/3 large subunit
MERDGQGRHRALLGDVTKNLGTILPLIKYASWFKDISEWKEKYLFFCVKSDPERGEKMKPQEVIGELLYKTL